MENLFTQLIDKANNMKSSLNTDFILNDIDLHEFPIYDGELKGLRSFQKDLETIEELSDTSQDKKLQELQNEKFSLLQNLQNMIGERLKFSIHNSDDDDLIKSLLSMKDNIAVLLNKLSSLRKRKADNKLDENNSYKKLSRLTNASIKDNDNSQRLSFNDSMQLPSPILQPYLPFYLQYPPHFQQNYYQPQMNIGNNGYQHPPMNFSINGQSSSVNRGKREKRKKLISNHTDNETDDTTEASDPEIDNLCLPLNEAEVNSLLDDLQSKLVDETITREVLLILGHKPGTQVEIDIEKLEAPKARTLIKYFEKLRKVQNKKMKNKRK